MSGNNSLKKSCPGCSSNSPALARGAHWSGDSESVDCAGKRLRRCCESKSKWMDSGFRDQPRVLPWVRCSASTRLTSNSCHLYPSCRLGTHRECSSWIAGAMTIRAALDDRTGRRAAVAIGAVRGLLGTIPDMWPWGPVPLAGGAARRSLQLGVHSRYVCVWLVLSPS